MVRDLVACRGIKIAEGWEYLAGMAVVDVSPDNAPEGLMAHQVPAARYGVLEWARQTTDEGFERIYQERLPASPYERDEPKPVLDCYPPKTPRRPILPFSSMCH